MDIYSYVNSVRKEGYAQKLMPTPLSTIRIPQVLESAGVAKNMARLRVLTTAGVITALLLFCMIVWVKQSSVKISFETSHQSSEPSSGTGSLGTSGLSASKMIYFVADRFEMISSGAVTPAQLQEQSVLTNWYGRRYRISRTLIRAIIQEAYMSAAKNRLDPHLVLAVIAIESGFNPYAESKVGAKGLMQVLPSAHPEKLSAYSSDDDLLLPLENIKVGTQVLRQYLKEQGSVELALKKYVGSINQNTDNGYAAKVLEESAQIKTLLDKKSDVIALNL